MSEFSTKTFGANLRILRKSKGLSQPKFGNLIDVCGSQISHYEHGKTPIDIEKLGILINKFGLDEILNLFKTD